MTRPPRMAWSVAGLLLDSGKPRTSMGRLKETFAMALEHVPKKLLDFFDI